jgi:hypothetical protein
MARRLTTNQEIAGSIPAVLICFARHQESGTLHLVRYKTVQSSGIKSATVGCQASLFAKPHDFRHGIRQTTGSTSELRSDPDAYLLWCCRCFVHA